MFERYTEKARRVIFFSRYEASQFGDRSIETPHLLLGLAREDHKLLKRFGQDLSIPALRAEIESTLEVRPRTSTSIDLPLSEECRHILAAAAEEAAMLGHAHVGTEHLLLGMLRVEKSMAAGLLVARGLRLDTIRNELRAAGHFESGIAEAAPGTGPVQLGRLVMDGGKLTASLYRQGLGIPLDHLTRALAAGPSNDLSLPRNELQLFFESLVAAIAERPNGADVLTPLIEGLDWKTMLSDVRTGLPEAQDWGFRLWLTLLLADLLLDRLDQADRSDQK